MFEPNSRYADVEQGIYTFPDGRTVAYVRRRFVPPATGARPLAHELVRGADRMDLIATRTIGDPEQAWRISDANHALDPDTLLRPGRRLIIPSPEP
jgi:hypothetical protein